MADDAPPAPAPLGSGLAPLPEPFAYLVTLRSGTQIPRFSRRPPAVVLEEWIKARRPGGDPLVRWIDGDGTLAEEIADVTLLKNDGGEV